MSKRCVGCMKLKTNSPVCEHCGYNENVPNENHQLPVGTVLQGRYQVGKVLGQGGFGITYIGWDLMLETIVAIKEYYPSSLVHRESTQNLTVSCTGSNAADLYAQNLDRFLREARILAKLQNVPGIVRVQNLFADNNTAYIIMEYVDGINLKQYIRMQQRVLTVAETLAVMQPVMRALNKVHESGLVHRDISPDNIMIQKNGSVKLLDFGAARQVEHADVNHDLTRSTQTILKHGFAPIEQYRSRGNLGPWTDVYALCATMYYCLTGKVPSEAPERVMGDDNVDWKQIPGLSPEQIATLEKGLALMPEHRISSMRELWQGFFGQRSSSKVSMQSKIHKTELAYASPSKQSIISLVESSADLIEKETTEYDSRTASLDESVPISKYESTPSDSVVIKKAKYKTKLVGFIVAIILTMATVLAVVTTAKLEKQMDEAIEPELNIPETSTEIQSPMESIYSSDSWNGWKTVDGKRHYFDSNGTMLTGFQNIDGKVYYFESDGTLQTGWKVIDGSQFYFSESGEMAIGLQNIQNNTYYFDNNGFLTRGWVIFNEGKCYFSEDGKLLKGEFSTGKHSYRTDDKGYISNNRITLGWHTVNNQKYYVDKNEQKIFGWGFIDKNIYYFHPDTGYMVAGSIEIKDSLCNFANNGILLSVPDMPVSNLSAYNANIHNIPEDSIEFNCHSYYLYYNSEIQSWEDAQAFCESQGGYLAVISSDIENSVLYSYAKSTGHVKAFFGYSDAIEEGTWKWVGPEKSEYTNWHPGQPNGNPSSIDDYAQFVEFFTDGTVNYSGEWSDSRYNLRYFICEWETVNSN